MSITIFYKPPGPLWATPGLLRDSFTFTFYYNFLYLVLLSTHFLKIWISSSSLSSVTS